MEKKVADLEAFEAEAARFAKELAPSPRGATLVTLSGELGAGKTAFTKAVAKTLGITETVTSPTFVLEKIYPIQNSPFTELVHIDAYRLESGEELGPLAFAATLKHPSALVLLEWPEKVADALPDPSVAITFTPHEDGSRTIAYAP